MKHLMKKKPKQQNKSKTDLQKKKTLATKLKQPTKKKNLNLTQKEKKENLN